MGAETWITGSYDPDLNLTYWGTAQAKPWMRASRGSGNGATLYANSTLALNADTGKLAWYYDHAPGETLDLDEVFERVLVDDQGQNYVFSAGKTGILWKLDRKTGKYLGHKEMVFQNVYDSFNPTTGEPHYRNDIVEQRIGEGVLGCPSTEGGKNWPAMSYYQPGNRLIVPLSQSCLEFAAQVVDKTEGAGAGAARGRATLRCRDRTETSASWRPTMCGRCARSGNTSSGRHFLPAFCRPRAAWRSRAT